MYRRILSILLGLILLLCLYPAVAAEGASDISEALVTYLKTSEGFQAMPYGDGTGWYIGYGCACDPADYPDGITEEDAEALLRERLGLCVEAVNAFLARYEAGVTQGQFDALCAMSYNFGTEWLNLSNRLPAYVATGIGGYTRQQIANAFAAWSHVGDTVSEDLLSRRIMELKMFLEEDYSSTTEGWSWLILDAAGGECAESDAALYRTGEPYGALPACTREGFDFAGWMTPDGSLLDASELVSGNLRLTAAWSAAPLSEPETGQVVTPFADVPEGAWYAAHLNTLASKGVVGGYEDGTFRPERAVSWGEALKLFTLSAGFPAQAAAKGKHWADGYRDYAVRKGFLLSTLGAPGAIDLNAAISRYEIAELCAAALELDTAAAAAAQSAFADTDRASVKALYAAGIMEGDTESGQRLYRGDSSFNRAELCAVLSRMLAYVDENFVFVSGIRAPVNSELTRNEYEDAAFYVSDGRLRYDGPAETVRCGIDVSYYQDKIDWEAVAADGIDFAIIRCGYRGYGAGGLYEDVRFRENVAGARAAGLDVGIYFFSQALSVAEALEEAAYTLTLIDGYDITFPVVFDWEQVTDAGSRSARPDWKTVTDCTVAFCDAVAAAGYTPMTYFNVSSAYLKLDMARIDAYPAWLAWYHETPGYIYDYQMWQYSSTGRVAGIEGNVDMNICFVNF